MNECPSLSELSAATTSANPHLRSHIDGCLRCSTLLSAWERGGFRDDVGPADDWELPALALTPTTLAGPDAPPVPGAIHSIGTPGSDLYLIALIDSVDEIAAGLLPISSEIWAAAAEDVLLHEQILGYRASVQLWNPINVLREQIEDRLVDDSPELRDLVELRGQPLPPQTAAGAPILTEIDPRRRFQQSERERVLPYCEPWRRTHTAEQLGTVMQTRRLELGAEIEELASVIDLPVRTVDLLEKDALDLYQTLPVTKLSRLVGHLELPPSRRLYRLVEAAVFGNDRSAAYGQERAAARRRRGMRGRVAPASEEDRRAHAQQYVDAFREQTQWPS